MTTQPFSSDDYSPEQTLIPFTRPIPLLRGPIPAGPTDDPELGPYVLGFPNTTSFLTALATCQSKLVEQCEVGSRVGCSISASKKCTPPWWKKIDYTEKAQCEEREMEGCLVGSTEKCAKFAEEKCLSPFGSARVRKESGLGLFGLLGRSVSSGLGPGSGYMGEGEDRVCCYVRGSEILGTSEL